MVEDLTTTPAEPPSTTVLLRVRLADRPSALSALTRRIGAVKGDLVGIEILERGDGWAVDELVVELPDPNLVDLMLREIDQEDGVEVQHLHRLVDTPFDPKLNAFEVAAVIAGSEDTDELLAALCAHTWRSVRSSWVCVVDRFGTILAGAGPTPEESWLASFLSDEDPTGNDAIWMPMPSAAASLVIGRPGVPFMAKERQKAAALARISDSLHSRLKQQRRLRSLLCHPTNGLPDSSPLLNQL